MTGMHLLFGWVFVTILLILVVWAATGPWIVHRLGGEQA